MLSLNDTICAVATSPGVGAIAVLRLSGKEAVKVADQLFSKSFEEILPNMVHFGKVKDVSGNTIDEVVLSYFKAPHSYTGEDVVEISCHGSLYIQNQLLEAMIGQGARVAEPGEFTQRAFLNRKLDLSQAEAVADLIAAESKASHQLALEQMRGGYSAEIEELRQQLINFASLIELELDFGEEDVEFANRKELFDLISTILNKIEPLIASFQYGNVIKNGVQTVIVGRPNAGKSTLLNTLLKEERAIVSEIAGTTRDTIEETINIKGTLFRLIDTAGIREATDTIEAIGVEKAIEKAKASAILVYLFDLSTSSVEQVKEDLESLDTPNMNLVLCGTKVDLITDEQKEKWVDEVKGIREKYDYASFYGISAAKGTNIELLANELYEMATTKVPESSVVVTNARHYEALTNAREALRKAEENMNANVSSDFVAMDIRTALHYLGRITGAIDVDADILGTIFGKFCIGK